MTFFQCPDDPCACGSFGSRASFVGGTSRGPAKFRHCSIMFELPEAALVTGLLLPNRGRGLLVHSVRFEIKSHETEQLLAPCPGEVFDSMPHLLGSSVARRVFVVLQRRPAEIRSKWIFRRDRFPHLIRKIVALGPSRRKPLSMGLKVLLTTDLSKGVFP